MLDFFQNDFALALQLVRVEAGVHERVGENVDPGVKESAGQHQVVDRLVVAGPGVDLAARSLHFARDLAYAALLRAFKQHMLEDVRDAG